MTPARTRRTLRVSTIALLAAAASALTACGSSASSGAPNSAPVSNGAIASTARPTATFQGVAAPPQSLVDAANAEGKITIYTSIASAGLTTGIAKAFNAVYPKISVRWVSDGSTQISGRYTTEAKAGATQADAVLTGYSDFFPT